MQTRIPQNEFRLAFGGLCGFLVLYVFSLETVSNRLLRSLEDTRSTLRDDVTYDAVILMGGVVQIWADQPEGRRSYNDNVERLPDEKVRELLALRPQFGIAPDPRLAGVGELFSNPKFGKP